MIKRLFKPEGRPSAGNNSSSSMTDPTAPAEGENQPGITRPLGKTRQGVDVIKIPLLGGSDEEKIAIASHVRVLKSISLSS